MTISKVGSLETIIEALQFASSTHRSNLENLLKETPLIVATKEGHVASVNFLLNYYIIL